ncbi:serine/threonine protein kinase [Actinomyces sp. 2119]|uniref:non-specific serine/threonine protein kinase n=1 Tax=Actinomyces lilanjuaniae TaxID=2321394 RepID=A0ABM6Z509_9ACTO|nr:MULTISPECIES: protein kinase [Actinomyces]AYD90432.1 serine/threonine protein kinase [Actinomyces lilanjuaniae]RJF40303.1 serine/threonine protein kinase [Actinomyces sp. 2119]
MLGQETTPPVIAGFTYLGVLGSGGYSTVYLFEQQMPRREVAVKVMNADVADRSASRFESEANLMARVSSHPAILSIYGAGVSADGHPFLVMEYCPPPTLGAILRQGALNVAETLSTAIQVAGAVETAHRAGIVHRDIKPANILFTTYRRPVLSDFGISVMSGPGGTEELRGMSVPWAPPEQLVGIRSASPASDVYSLGATTFAMLTGHSPFEVGGVPDVYELSRRIVKDPLPPLGRQDAPPSLHRVLSVAMDKSPQARYPTALALARALQQVQAELDLPVTTVDLFQEADAATARPPRPEEDDEATNMGVFSQVHRTSDGLTVRVDPDDVAQPGAVSGTVGGQTHAARRREAGSPVGRSRESRLRAVVGLVLAVVLVAVVVGVVLVARDRENRGQSASFETIAPPAGAADPLGSGVPSPADVSGTANKDGTVTFSWDPPYEEWGGGYLVREIVPDEDTAVESTRDTSVVVEARPGQTCVEVSSLRQDGKASPAVTACVVS